MAKTVAILVSSRCGFASFGGRRVRHPSRTGVRQAVGGVGDVCGCAAGSTWTPESVSAMCRFVIRAEQRIGEPCCLLITPFYFSMCALVSWAVSVETHGKMVIRCFLSVDAITKNRGVPWCSQRVARRAQRRPRLPPAAARQGSTINDMPDFSDRCEKLGTARPLRNQQFCVFVGTAIFRLCIRRRRCMKLWPKIIASWSP